MDARITITHQAMIITQQAQELEMAAQQINRLQAEAKKSSNLIKDLEAKIALSSSGCTAEDQ